MILDSITLNNFGAYCGRQEAMLTPEDGKPIILFGGMNGGGKTTLLMQYSLFFTDKRHVYLIAVASVIILICVNPFTEVAIRKKALGSSYASVV